MTTDNPDDTSPSPPPEPPGLRFLRRLVTLLTAVMIAGISTIVVLLALRLNTPPPPALPDEITLPKGVTAYALTFGPGWYAVVTDTDEILIFDAGTGALRRRVGIGE